MSSELPQLIAVTGPERVGVVNQSTGDLEFSVDLRGRPPNEVRSEYDLMKTLYAEMHGVPLTLVPDLLVK